ncbi:MAG TPA: DUF3857 domain-containing protein [Lentimicrobium sp.]|nr:DUF3857 domain-containing protein [Lentimicrobium sp.]
MMRPSILTFLLILLFDFGFCQKYDAEVIEYKTSCFIDGNNLKVYKSFIIQINNRNGEKYGFFNVPYSKNEPLTGLIASVHDAEGNEIKSLKKSDIVDRNAYSDYLYTDDFVKSFQLKHSEYPYLIKCSYAREEKNFMQITHWTPVLYESIPTRNATLKVNIPPNYKFKEYSKDVALASKDTADDLVRFEWRASYLKPIKEEIFSNPNNYYPQVIVVPEDFKYGIEGSNNSWEAFGTWIDNLANGLDVIPEEELPVINNLINGLTDKREIVKVLYHYLQDHTRYINVSIGVGGYKPYPAKYVSINKYGDCKALTNYMKALLKHAGIRSYYTLVNSGDQPEAIFKEITTNQFDHVILAVPLENDTLWLENTSNINPFAYLGTFTQNRDALMTNASGSRFVKTPSLKEDMVTGSKNITYTLNLDGTAKVSLKNTYRGDDFETLNAVSNNFDEETKDEIVRNAMNFENYEVTSWEIGKRHRDSAKIVLHATLDLHKFVNSLGTDYFFSLNPVGLPGFTNTANRTLPVELPYPIVQKDTIKYNLPEGYTLKNKYEPVNISTSYGTFDLKILSENNTVTAIKSLRIFPGTYSLEQYPEFYAFIESVRKTEKAKIVIKQP